ncbi:uncharacterized protein LOC135397440 [Ornithodoros turicata]|uniref:uncharacterized protein LOC135397440 n=1 Tax=Ornithodoros turicata TaxID=34597 RepID=UPI0031393182
MKSCLNTTALTLIMTCLLIANVFGQITFSKNWQPGKRGEMCSQAEAKAVMKIRQVLLEEAKLFAQCKMYYANEGANEE